MGCGLADLIFAIDSAKGLTEDATDVAEKDKPRSQTPLVGDGDGHALRCIMTLEHFHLVEMLSIPPLVLPRL